MSANINHNKKVKINNLKSWIRYTSKEQYDKVSRKIQSNANLLENIEVGRKVLGRYLLEWKHEGNKRKLLDFIADINR